MFEDPLQGHRVATNPAKVEKIAIALPFSMVESDLMIVVIAAKGNGEFVKLKSFRLLGVPFGFLDLSDHAVVHRRSPWKKKAR
jgi:hypothetical protein